jgi:hypothetical protein
MKIKTLKQMKSLLIIILLVLTKSWGYSQDSNLHKDKEHLKREILKMDSLLFSEAFNKCNLELFKKIMSKEFEFYDDRSGLNTSFQKEVASFQDRCSKPFKVTRELVNCSVHILGNYGAVQTGVHDFFVDSKKVETAKFITIWEKTVDSWIVKRVISYDHEQI